jgi:hypothetical protein
MVYLKQIVAVWGGDLVRASICQTSYFALDVLRGLSSKITFRFVMKGEIPK